MESGEFKPSIPLARKLEKFLRIRLVDKYAEKHETRAKSPKGILTIGDLIKVRKR